MYYIIRIHHNCEGGIENNMSFGITRLTER